MNKIMHCRKQIRFTPISLLQIVCQPACRLAGLSAFALVGPPGGSA